eukprot:TRINITY_DN13293_c1_g4_i4.p1 TRINITY_DN13293_c1_g4~~TRINITY_DN13293_c1_g4_i4.p1  ORF type:complete len:380 (-),score=67.93 TRINITY_DN13293_c1_g4_i4:1129-2268(-)
MGAGPDLIGDAVEPQRSDARDTKDRRGASGSGGNHTSAGGANTATSGQAYNGIYQGGNNNSWGSGGVSGRSDGASAPVRGSEGMAGAVRGTEASTGASPGMTESSVDMTYLTRAAGLLLEMARADGLVKAQFCSQSLLRRLLDLLDMLNPTVQVQVLACIKQVAMDTNCLDALQRADTIKRLVPFLAVRPGGLGRDMLTQAICALYYLCRVNKRRQELAAEAGVIPPLIHLVALHSPLQQFALPLLCDMAHTSRTTREMLRQQGGVELYLGLLQDSAFGVTALESLAVCLAHDNEQRRVESMLLRRDALARLVLFFEKCQGEAFVLMLEPLVKMMMKSSRLTTGLSMSGITPILVARMEKADPGARLSLVKMMKLLHPP